jgi:type I restriction enzyme S subunit
MMGRPMATSQDFANWVCSDKINPHFLKYVFLLENAALKRFSYGTTHQTIYYPELKAFHVCLPDRAEQDRIVAVLKSLDDKIEMNRQMCATLEEMARALYRSWFVDFDPVRAREIGQTPAFMDDATVALFPDRFGEDGLPEGWRKQPYNDLIELVSGGTPQTSREEYWGGSIPWYSVVDMPRDGIFVINTEKAITDLGLKNSPARLLEKGDSIISARGTVGKIAMVGAPMAFNQSCYGLRGKNKGIGSAFVFLATSNAVEDLKSRAHGSVFSTITRSTFDGLTLTADDGAILPAFEARLAPLLGRMLNAQLEACTLASLRDTLLPKLMSGEIRLREAEAQVEEVM